MRLARQVSRVPVVALLNQKGGVGKTSLTHHLAGELARRGRRVLAIDNDPQASLTQGLLGPEATAELPAETTVAALYGHEAPLLEYVVRESGVRGVELVAGSIAAHQHDSLGGRGETTARMALADALADIELLGEWEVVLIDCPPNLRLLSTAALLACSQLLMPVQPEDYGAQGIAPVLAAAEAIGRLNARMGEPAIVINRIDARLSLHGVYAQRLRSFHGELVMEAMVPSAVAYPEAVAHRAPVCDYAPRSKAAEAIRALCDELLARMTPAATEGVATEAPKAEVI